MGLTVAVLDTMGETTQLIDVPDMRSRDGRADLKGIRRHLRTLGLTANRICVTHRTMHESENELTHIAA